MNMGSLSYSVGATAVKSYIPMYLLHHVEETERCFTLCDAVGLMKGMASGSD